MKKVLIAVVLSTVPAFAFAQANNIGGCGVGSKLFDGQSGILPNIFAVTTNNYSGQTFAITSGTSGCSQDGVVRSNWKMSMFIDGNKDQLARDMSIGNGETLDSLAHLIGVRDTDRATFNRTAQENLSSIFPSETASTEQVVAGLKKVLSENRELSQ